MIGSLGTAIFIIAFFFLGGIVFTVVMPEIWIGQIWIAVAVLVGIFFFALARREAGQRRIKAEGVRGTARILGGDQTGTQVNDQPVMALRLRVEAPGVTPFELRKKAIVPLLAIGALGSGRPLPVYLERGKTDDVVIDWDEFVAAAGTLPASPAPATTSAPAAGSADESGNTLARLQELMELKNAQLISDEDFAQHKERILRGV